jgi:hypothetical protein
LASSSRVTSPRVQKYKLRGQWRQRQQMVVKWLNPDFMNGLKRASWKGSPPLSPPPRTSRVLQTVVQQMVEVTKYEYKKMCVGVGGSHWHLPLVLIFLSLVQLEMAQLSSRLSRCPLKNGWGKRRTPRTTEWKLRLYA